MPKPPDEQKRRLLRKCKTPGALFHTHVRPEGFEVEMLHPKEIDLTEEQAEKIEDQVHDALEAIYAEYY